MIPIQELLNRIRWDAEFRKGNFELGYYDRRKDRIILVPLDQIDFEPGNHFSFEITDSNNETHTIPFHRVKEVYKNGELIWRRKY